MNVRTYAVVTGGYWAFTLTDGALRMAVEKDPRMQGIPSTKGSL